MWQDFDAGGTRNRNRRRKNMSGIPGMGQRWQAVLKIRVIMIPLPENTAAGAASGDSCGVKGCCRVFRQPSRAILTYSVPHRGRENYKSMAGHYALSWRVGLFCGRGISDTDYGERIIIYINFATRCRKAGGIKFCLRKFKTQRCKPCISL